MKRICIFIWLLICLCACSDRIETAKDNNNDRYFGLHCDFHAYPYDYYAEHPIGGTLKEDEIREFCRELKLDFLQIDCKGHPGWTSYPSKCGNAIPYIKEDPLKTWRRVTKEEGVKLFMHYSGVLDFNYVAKNPNEAAVLADGSRSSQATRTNGNYADQLLIPQLKELAGEYGVDGVWVDGDCWGALADFDPSTITQFEKETGINLKGTIPAEKGMPYYNEYKDFCRNLFRQYLNHYLDAIHSDYPSFKMTSNWAFTDHMPEKVCANVDYISGDLAPRDSYWWARYSGRAIEKQGKPWDLMAIGFRSDDAGGMVFKEPVQLMQEAAGVISLGGGFQVCINQLIDGSPRTDLIRTLYPLADFMHQRKKWCFQGHLEPQVAVLLSTHDRYLESEGLFSRNGCEKVMSMVNLICEAGHSVSVVSEHDLADGKINSYPVIVIPELYEGLEDKTMDILNEYVREQGGSLILNGGNTCRLFAEKGFPEGENVALTLPNILVRIFDPLSVDGNQIAEKEIENYSLPVKNYGKGKVAAVNSDVAKSYFELAQSKVADMFDNVLLQMYEPRIRIESSKGKLDIVDLWKDGKMLIQLVNANGLHHASNNLTEKTIAPVTDIILKIRLDKKPSGIRLQPDDKSLKYEWKEGYALVSIPEVELHSVVQIM